MKKFLTYLMIFTAGFVFHSCDKPAPTQLIDDSPDDLEVELLNKNLDDQYFPSGADTSGITQNLTGITNLISVSGIKITSSRGTLNSSLAQAIFFNKNEPIRYSDDRIIAYKTLTPGVIKFNGTEANVVPYRIRYRDLGELKDTLLGFKYQLYNIIGGLPDPFYFGYNSNVSLEFIPFGSGNSLAFNIPTPKEITGKVVLSGNKLSKTLEAVLKWNHLNSKRITIIIGLIKANQISSIPIYRMKTVDDGELRIPKRYFDQLPLERFEKIVFTFVRSYEGYHSNGTNDLFASSQSIHSIVIDIP